jgi:CxxC motif-containing protein
VKTIFCISCPNGCLLKVYGGAYDLNVEGNGCDEGLAYAESEMRTPSRTLTTTVRTKFPGVPVLSVRTDGEIPKNIIMDAINELNQITIETEMNCGDILVEDIADTGVSVIVTSCALMKLGAELENKNVELGRSSSPGSADDATGDMGSFGVSNIRVLDDLGAEAAGGIVGTAGEAVGVEDAEEEQDEQAAEEGSGRLKQRNRPHIKRR